MHFSDFQFYMLKQINTATSLKNILPRLQVSFVIIEECVGLMFCAAYAPWEDRHSHKGVLYHDTQEHNNLQYKGTC